MGISLLTFMIIQAIPIAMYASGLETGYGYLLILYGVCTVVGFKEDRNSETEMMIMFLTISYLLGFIWTLAMWVEFL